jgi:hypothetical protein
MTLNAGTSTIICQNANSNFIGAGLTYYNLSFTSNAVGTHSFAFGANTFNDLTFTSLAATGIRNISVGANQTVNGTLTLGTANTAIRRMFMRSDVVGTIYTLTVATMATLADVDFRDITIAGAASPVSGTRLGNCGGNTGITFDAGKNVYRVGTGNWSATQWSLSSGGSVDVNNFPLAQDTALFDTGTTTGTHTIDQAWNIGTIDMSALNVAVTLAVNSTPIIYGNVTLDADVTLSLTNNITFSGASNQTITSAGVTFTQPLFINKPAGTSVTLADNVTSNLAFTLNQGTLALNNNTLTCLTFSSTNSNTRSIAFGTGSINVTGNNTTVLLFTTMTNFTHTGTPNFNFTYSGSVGTRLVDCGLGGTNGATESNVLNLTITAGFDTLRFFGACSFKNFTLTDNFSGTVGTTLGSYDRPPIIYGNLLLSTNATYTFTTTQPLIFFAST